MVSTYPLNPVVSEDPAFAQKYNEDFMSAFYLSECISFNQAKDLISQNASFSRIVFLDKESAYVEDFRNRHLQSTAAIPEMIAISQSGSADETVKKIHNEICNIRKGTG